MQSRLASSLLCSQGQPCASDSPASTSQVLACATMYDFFSHAEYVLYQLRYIPSPQDLDSSELQLIFPPAPPHHPIPSKFIFLPKNTHPMCIPIHDLFLQEKAVKPTWKHKLPCISSPTAIHQLSCSVSDLNFRALSRTPFTHSSHPQHSFLTPSTVVL